jgi:hypothetical protein
MRAKTLLGITLASVPAGGFGAQPRIDGFQLQHAQSRA